MRLAKRILRLRVLLQLRVRVLVCVYLCAFAYPLCARACVRVLSVGVSFVAEGFKKEVSLMATLKHDSMYTHARTHTHACVRVRGLLNE